MRVVVSGASGLIGSALVEELEQAGHGVLRLVRRQAGADEHAWDPSTGRLDPAVLEAAAAVVHLSGAGIGDHRWSASRRKELVTSRIESTALLVNSMEKLAQAPSVFVCASAIGFYGDRGDDLLTERSEAGTGFLADLCRRWEHAASRARDLGIRTVSARSGIVLSTSGGALARQLPLFRLGLGGRLGTGRQWTSWVSIEDEVRALRLAVESESLSGPVNVVAPGPVRNGDFTKALGRALRRPAVMAVPPVALRLALGRPLVDEALLASQRVVPQALEAAGFTFRHPELDSALTALLGR